jgi:hypothetical protein
MNQFIRFILELDQLKHKLTNEEIVNAGTNVINAVGNIIQVIIIK